MSDVTLIILTIIVGLYACYDEDKALWKSVVAYILLFILICIDLAILF